MKYPHQQVIIEFIMSMGDIDAKIEETLASKKNAARKNGFVGPMNKHSAGMQNYRTINLDPSEWRRL